MTSWLDDVHFNEDGLIPAIAQDWQTGRVLMVAWMNAESLQLTAARRQGIYWSRSRQKLWHKGESSGHVQIVHEIRLDCDGDVIVLQVEQQGGIACHTGRESCFYRVLTAQGWQVTDAVRKDPAAIYGDLATGQLTAEQATAEQATAEQASTGPLPDVHLPGGQPDILYHLGELMQQRLQASQDPASADKSYVVSLYRKGLDHILKKVAEEAAETLMAAKDAGAAGQPLSAEVRGHLVYETADLWFHTLVMLGRFTIPPAAVLTELERRTGQSGLAEKAARQTGD